MEPEPGDREVHVRRSDVAEAAAEVGIIPGDTVMFHSSLSSMGTVIGGPNTVIDGLLDAVGPTGTVAVPTLCNWAVEEKPAVFGRWSPAKSPSYVGRISETFRNRADAVRSDHATHSVAAIGARARELTEGHGAGRLRPGPFGDRAFAGESPWQRFVDWNAAYCFIGVNFRVNTMVHYVETMVVMRALAGLTGAAQAQLASQVEGWLRPGVWPRIRIDDREVAEKALAREGMVRYGDIGSATLICARAEPMVERWLIMLEADPERWFPTGFMEWLRECDAATRER